MATSRVTDADSPLQAESEAPKRFSSTCGGARLYSFGEATLAGWAEDGGMLWPRAVPSVSTAVLQAWARLSYPQLCAEVLKLFVDADDEDVSHGDIDAIALDAFSAFGSERVVEVQPLPFGVHVAELWHGPTLAFKDLGMSVLARVLSHILRRRRERLTLLVGTSGDTGSSAIEAVRGLPGLELIVLYPLPTHSSITPVQERQMTSGAESAPNVRVVGVEGSSDDLDVPMEACFRDGPFAAEQRLGSVNSVNVVRLVVQAVHYFYAYLQLEPSAARPAQFAVPCGAGGHLAAGVLAMQMGLPVHLLAATNANDALHRVLSTGRLSAGRETVQTISPSMDIQMPYNVWRLLHWASGGCGTAVRSWQSELASRGEVVIPQELRARIAARVRSVAVGDEETLATMREVHATSGYVLDPHTAVGVAAARRSPFGAGGPASQREATVCMGCAHAVKFLPAVARALSGLSPEAAIDAVPDKAHRNVAAVRRMAQQLVKAAEPAGAAHGATAMPSGCTAVFRRGEDWEARLRALITATADHAAAHTPTASRL